MRYLPLPCAVFKMLNDGCVSPLPTAAFSVVISMSVELRIFQEEFCVTQVTARPHFTSQSSPWAQMMGMLATSASIDFCCWLAHPVRRKAAATDALAMSLIIFMRNVLTKKRKSKQWKGSPLPTGGHSPSWLDGDSRGLDAGIRKAVERLQECGIETFESCEGGARHSYPEPTIRFHGTPEAGWRAVGVCLAHGLPILFLRRVWCVLDSNEPNGPYWEIIFRERPC